MNETIFKTGSCSIVLGKNHYQGFIKPKENKLIKITKINAKHNELKHIDTIKQIENWSNYYALPDDITFVLYKTERFYKHVFELANDITLFNDTLIYFYVDYAGNKELHETIDDINNKQDFSFWNSVKSIINFSKQIMEGLSFLHSRKLCHLDVKPENIMINTNTRQFKLIDFGFCSKEPFDNYVSNIRGTPYYFPHHFVGMGVMPWLPKIEATDLEKDKYNQYLLKKERERVYKIDSYCLGRTLYSLKYVYLDNVTYGCCSYSEKNDTKKINSIVDSLLECDPRKRITIQQCLDVYF